MDAADPQFAPGVPHAPTIDSPAVRDAETRVEQAQDDERAAIELRRRLTGGDLPTIEPDEAIAVMLTTGERVIAVRESVVVERYATDATQPPSVGRLFLTTDRLVLMSGSPTSIPVSSIDELGVAGERVLISLTDGTGLRLDAGAPRVLRLLIAAVRARKRETEPG